jgi:hypothetical protein|tara:strand:+ start:1068 stop:2573 length:1506 start_codon:yes stop_codon:yes gene_type:complete
MLSSCLSTDGYLISAFQDGDKVVIKAEGKHNKKNVSEHRHYFVRCPVKGLDTKFIDINNWEDIFLNVRDYGITEGFYFEITTSETETTSVASKLPKTNEIQVRHKETTTENSYTSTGKKLSAHWPIFKKFQLTKYPSIIRATMTLHQVCASKCSFCSTINRTKKDAISLEEAKMFANTLYDQQAAFNLKYFKEFNQEYKNLTGSDIRLRSLILSGGGQPNLWPHFSQFVTWLSNKKIDLGLITNGFPKHVEEDIYKHFKWIRLSITPEDASPFYVDKKFELQPIPNIVKHNKDITLGLSYVYGPWTSDEILKRLNDTAEHWGAEYVRLLTDCTLPREKQLIAHQDLAERLFRLGLIDATGRPLGKIFHQLKYHGSKEEVGNIWDDKQCKLQIYNTFWDTTGHEENKDSYCYPCDSVTVLADTEQRQQAQRKFDGGKWGTVLSKNVNELFEKPLHSFFDPNANCQGCLFVDNNKMVKKLISLDVDDYSAIKIDPEIKHLNFP